MKDNFEVPTTTDKAQRDRMFEDLRHHGNELERKAVKFSSNEPYVVSEDHGFIGSLSVLKFRSTWSVAYPRS